MKKIPSKVAVIISISLLALTNHSFAKEKPPANAASLSKIVKSIEDKGYSPITEISFEHGVWEAEAYKGLAKRELKVNPTDGSIISDRADN